MTALAVRGLTLYTRLASKNRNLHASGSQVVGLKACTTTGWLLGISCKDQIDHTRGVILNSYPIFRISTLSGKKFYWLLFCWLPLLDVPFGSPLPLETKLCYWLCCAQHSCPHSVQLPCFPQWDKNNPSPLFHSRRHEPDDLVRFNYVLLGMYLGNVPLYTLLFRSLAVPWTLYRTQVRPNFKGRGKLNKLRHKMGMNPGNHILDG